MALADDIQVIAFHEIVADTDGARKRQLYRWYSKTFSTPLHIVHTLPLTDILCAFWEERYSHMDQDELEDERQRLLETPEERAAKALAEESDEMGTDALLRQLEEEAAQAAAKPPSVPKKLDDIKPPEPIKTREKIPEANLPAPKEPIGPLPESVSIKFAATDFFDELADQLDAIEPGEDRNLLGKPPPKSKT